MTVWAGIDIGNASTEVVLCRETSLGAAELVASARVRHAVAKGPWLRSRAPRA